MSILVQTTHQQSPIFPLQYTHLLFHIKALTALFILEAYFFHDNTWDNDFISLRYMSPYADNMRLKSSFRKDKKGAQYFTSWLYKNAFDTVPHKRLIKKKSKKKKKKH